MGRPLDIDESKEPSEDSGTARGAGAPNPEGNPARWRREIREMLDSLRERRRRLLEQDDRGRTPLFYAAEKGDEEEVWEILSRFRGTGLGPPRLALITIKDRDGLTAADVAEQNGHDEIARLLHKEQGRMEFFE